MATLQLGKIKLSMPVQLVLLFILFFFLGKHIPVSVKSFIYAISLSIKTVLIFVLPFIIFSYLFACILSFRKGVVLFISGLFVAVCLSNFISTMAAYFIGFFCLNEASTIQLMTDGSTMLTPLWNFKLPRLIPNDVALFSGIACGILFTYFPNAKAEKAALVLKSSATHFLNRCFIPLVPLFISGFLLKLEHEDLLASIFKQYGSIYALIFTTQASYLLLCYLVAAEFNIKEFARYLKNVLPSAITGFSTMSSAAALPLILEGAERNTRNENAARTIVPSAVNIHLIGCNIAIPILAMTIMVNFGLPLPCPETYLIFALYFVVAKFAVAAVPAGGVLVMLPVMERHLGFNGEMLSLITALYIIADAFITTSNVLGNGMFAVAFEKLSRKLGILKVKTA